MRRAIVRVLEKHAGYLTELNPGYRFTYTADYPGPPVSLTLPVRAQPYEFAEFPPFFDGLLPEGVMLDALLRAAKLDATDLFGQLLAVGKDTVGAVSVVPEEPAIRNLTEAER